MKILPSDTELGRQRRCRLQRFAVLAGVSLTLVAFLMPITGSFCVTSPVHAFSRQTREAGAATFREKGCEHCHGTEGIGTDRGPDLSGVGRQWKKDRIERQILEGGGGMPPFGGALQLDEVKNLVDYLSAKRKTPKKGVKPPTAINLPPEDSGF